MNDSASPRRLRALLALTALAVAALASAGCAGNAGQGDTEAPPAETVDAGAAGPDASLHTLGRNRCFLNCMHGSKGNDMGGFCAVACGFL